MLVAVLVPGGAHGLHVQAHIFKALEEKVERFDYDFQKKCVENRDFEALEMYVMNLLMGLASFSTSRRVTSMFRSLRSLTPGP